ncbi:Myosin heavy chain, clone like [Actinidia chinensis var. chinensis]|uniref:Myosin heavy chain, clone like n=1 Tax=Actinidia chinensis var. chinensis TaxID=1590841 RepID=A0A2R6QA69_ACTCC|nr:Myosin heavy chain, clone like [Actinidia chinensis var. chinensis]
MAASLFFIAAILSSYLTVLSVSTPSISQIGTETSRGNNHENHHLIRDLEKAKLKIARLESIFEETIQDINAKVLHLKESQKLIEEMTPEMNRLQSALSSLKGKSSRADERINQLEEEVRLLWATLRKSNFELHLLESKAENAENRLELVTSQVETMAAIVTEQWIQIRQLEQALHMAEMRALKVKREVSSTRCRFLKFVRNLFSNHIQKLTGMLDSFLLDKESALGSYVSRALHQLETILSAAKKYHHELQGFIQQEMERNEFTAALANKEVVFFVASAIITFPMMSAWMLLSSQFS